jgi:hypothetical protein
MGYNIGNPDGHEFAARLCRRLDTSTTGAVAIASRQKLAATEIAILVEENL